MNEKIAVVGPRRGAPLDEVRQFVINLFAVSPDATLISGGAEGVDQAAETTWYQLGGKVKSYRIEKLADDEFGVKVWELNPAHNGDEASNRIYSLLWPPHPTFYEPKGVLWYRSMLVAEEADRVVAFHGTSLMRGTEITESFVIAEGKPLHVWDNGRWL